MRGGTYGWGTVFKLAQRGSGWTLSPLHEFAGGSDGENPWAPVTVGPNGALYGTTGFGGSTGGGTVFELQPPPTACKTTICYWNETLLHTFQGGANDGWGNYEMYYNMIASYANLTFDHAAGVTLDSSGNLYGTTYRGGNLSDCVEFDYEGCGVVWEISDLADRH